MSISPMDYDGAVATVDALEAACADLRARVDKLEREAAAGRALRADGHCHAKWITIPEGGTDCECPCRWCAAARRYDATLDGAA